MFNDSESKFPKIKKSITDFINDEDGSITRGKLISIGSMVLLMTVLAAIDAQAAHRSHSSHSSHSSTSYHRSHVSHVSHSSSSNYHSSHSSHSDHGSHSNHSNHSSHSSHTSHSNTSTHSNSLYSIEGDVEYGPDISEISGVSTPKSTTAYAKTTIADGISVITPSISEFTHPQNIDDVDIKAKE